MADARPGGQTWAASRSGSFPPAPGRRRGEQEGIALSEFLREPLIRLYGEAWYGKLVDHLRRRAEGSRDISC